MLTSFSRKNLTSPSSESLMPKDLSMPKSPFSTAINTERKCSTSAASQVWSITLFLKLYCSKLLEFLPPIFEGAEEEPVSEINGTHDRMPFPIMANQFAF